LRLLSGLRRPLIQRRWAAMVAQLNALEESQLDAFLFGVDRVQTAKVRVGLWEIQGRRCFYCDARVGEPVRAHVDHFIPWSRYPDNGLDNLVVADIACNQAKSSSLAASHHVARWAQRFASESAERREIDTLAHETAWERDRRRSLGVARGIYWHLPHESRLWLKQKEFVAIDRPMLDQALGVFDVLDEAPA
jgi:hypothetical protein